MPSNSDLMTDCDDCVMPVHQTDDYQITPGLLKCVTCPFCKQTVTAIITPEEIKCPECLAVVKR